jgi:hypothetical protein
LRVADALNHVAMVALTTDGQEPREQPSSSSTAAMCIAVGNCRAEAHDTPSDPTKQLPFCRCLPCLEVLTLCFS